VAFACSSYYISSIFFKGTLVETLFPILGDTYFMEFWHGLNPNLPLSPWICLIGDGPLSILGFDYFISYGALHLLGILHIHPWSWLPWDSHMWIGYMHFVDY
jgi:hypothetical protein